MRFSTVGLHLHLIPAVGTMEPGSGSDKSVKAKKRPRFCAKCRKHNLLEEMRGHKRECYYSSCQCMKCWPVDVKRLNTRINVKLRRDAILEQERQAKRARETHAPFCGTPSEANSLPESPLPPKENIAYVTQRFPLLSVSGDGAPAQNHPKENSHLQAHHRTLHQDLHSVERRSSSESMSPVPQATTLAAAIETDISSMDPRDLRPQHKKNMDRRESPHHPEPQGPDQRTLHPTKGSLGPVVETPHPKVPKRKSIGFPWHSLTQGKESGVSLWSAGAGQHYNWARPSYYIPPLGEHRVKDLMEPVGRLYAPFPPRHLDPIAYFFPYSYPHPSTSYSAYDYEKFPNSIELAWRSGELDARNFKGVGERWPVAHVWPTSRVEPAERLCIPAHQVCSIDPPDPSSLAGFLQPGRASPGCSYD